MLRRARTLGDVPRTQAVLVDVYETALTCDFSLHDVELPRAAGVHLDVWARKSRDVGRQLMDGRKSLAEAFEAVVTSAGGTASPDLVRQLVELDQELLLRQVVLYEDTVPFLRTLRSRGIRTALVSNCAENTAAMLDKLGLTSMVDAVVLSCDVGYVKPLPKIYEEALRRLGVAPENATFIDDRLEYCQGAAALGLSAIRIQRGSAACDRGEVGSLEAAQRLIE